MGFSQEEINDLPDSEILKYKDAKLVGKSQKYYRVDYELSDEGKELKDKHVTELSEEQCLKEVEEFKKEQAKKILNLKSNSLSIMSNSFRIMSNYDSKSTSKTTPNWIKLTTYATYKSGTRYFFSNYAQWLTDPYYHMVDVLGIGHTTAISETPGTEYFYYKWDKTLSNGTKTTYTTTSTSATCCDPGGMAFKFTLTPHGDNRTYSISNHRVYMSYYGYVTPTNYNGYFNIYGNYAHNENGWVAYPSISYPYGGSISVQPTNYYDNAYNTNIQIHAGY